MCVRECDFDIFLLNPVVIIKTSYKMVEEMKRARWKKKVFFFSNRWNDALQTNLKTGDESYVPESRFHL